MSFLGVANTIGLTRLPWGLRRGVTAAGPADLWIDTSGDVNIVGSLTIDTDLTVTGVTTLVGGETFQGLVTVTSSTGAGAAGALGPHEVEVETTQAATLGAQIRNPGYLDWEGNYWDATGGVPLSKRLGRFGALADTIDANGVPTAYRMVWTNTAGTIVWDADESGNTAQAGIMYVANGAEATPAYSFGADTNTGFWTTGSDTIRVSCNGSSLGGFTTSGIELGSSRRVETGSFYVSTTGSAAAPSYLRSGDINTGLYYPGDDQFAVTCGGVQQQQWSTTVCIIAQPISAPGIATGAQNGLNVGPYGAGFGATGESRWRELTANGSNYVGFKSPDSIAANVIWVLPNADAAGADYALVSDGALGLSWYNMGGAFGPIGSEYVTISADATLTSERVLTAGTAIGLADGGAGGNVTLTNTGVTSAVATANQVSVSGATGDITFSTPQDIGTSSSVEFANVTVGTAGAVRTDTGAGNTTLLQAYDVDGTAYVTFGTLTANNQPTFDLSTSVTMGTNAIYYASGTDVAPADGGTGINSSVSTGIPRIALGTWSVQTLTDGQLMIGDTGAAPVAATLTGTADRITVSGGAGSITLNAPQDLDTGADFAVGTIDCTTTARGTGFIADADPGGTAGTNTWGGTTTASDMTMAVLGNVPSGVAAARAVWIKCYVGTTATYVPGWQ